MAFRGQELVRRMSDGGSVENVNNEGSLASSVETGTLQLFSGEHGGSRVTTPLPLIEESAF